MANFNRISILKKFLSIGDSKKQRLNPNPTCLNILNKLLNILQNNILTNFVLFCTPLEIIPLI